MRLYVKNPTCQWCESSADFESVEEATAEGWVHLEHGEGDDVNEYTFCSWDCLVSFL